MSEPPALYPMVTMMVISLVSWLSIMWLPRSFRRWVNDASRSKRWTFRAVLFLAAFLAPCAVVAIGMDLLLRVGSLHDAFLSLPWTARIASFVVPVIAFWLFFFRVLLNEFRSQAFK